MYTAEIGTEVYIYIHISELHNYETKWGKIIHWKMINPKHQSDIYLDLKGRKWIISESDLWKSCHCHFNLNSHRVRQLTMNMNLCYHFKIHYYWACNDKNPKVDIKPYNFHPFQDYPLMYYSILPLFPWWFIYVLISFLRLF